MAMNLRLPDEDAEALRQLAEEEGRSMNEVTVTALREYKHRKRRDAILARMMVEDRELLDRLANT